jgi:hypothetical protein
VAADVRTALLAQVQAMYGHAVYLTTAVGAFARTAAQDGNHAVSGEFSRLAIVLGEFRNGLASLSFFRGGG